MKIGLFIFASPLHKHEGSIYYDDAAHQNTVELCNSIFDKIIIVARCREVLKHNLVHKSLNDTRALLVLELPDFGIGGYKGWYNFFRLFFSPALQNSLAALFKHADFIYTEAPSLEGLLSTVIAMRSGRSLTFETRGEVLFNQDYMLQRFGNIGFLYAKVFEWIYTAIRRKSLAGLFVSPTMMLRYSLSNTYQESISDVQLPENLPDRSRHFTTPASRFIYVGHLEKVKRVDLILRAFHLVRDILPTNWKFDIIGDGPEMHELQALAKQLEVHANVQFHGRLTRGPSLFEFYSKADTLLMASTTEGASRTLIEGMAYGLPIISTKVGTAPDLLEDCALVAVDDTPKYAAVLARVATDPTILTKLSAQNWKRAQNFQPALLYEKRKNFFLKAVELSIEERNMQNN